MPGVTNSTVQSVPAPVQIPAMPPLAGPAQDQLRTVARHLLETGTVAVVIGYGRAAHTEHTFPVFITKAADVDRLVWNRHCDVNLTVYLKRQEIRSLGRPAIVVKGCDERTLVVLQHESQIDRGQMVVIGMACDGMAPEGPAAHDASALEPRCTACRTRVPRFADQTIGTAQPAPAEADRFAELAAFMAQTPEQRMAYWQAEFSRCVKCYACRQACPLCYCTTCIADKNRPTCFDTSASLKGNFAWHITRAFHMSGRCVGCDQCTRACPAGINLRLLNLSLAKAAEDNFQVQAGMDAQAPGVVGAFSMDDRESFIR